MFTYYMVKLELPGCVKDWDCRTVAIFVFLYYVNVRTVRAAVTALSSRTFGAAVVAADAEPLCIALNIFVVQLDPERPAQVWLPHRVLESSPGISKPVGDLEKERND